MTALTGYTKVFDGDTDAVDSYENNPVGTRAFDKNGNEYIYLKGVADTEAGSWVTFDEDGATTLSDENALGRVAIAMAAITADKYGWYQIYGKNTIALIGGTDAVDDNSELYLTASPGRVDDADVAGDLIKGAISRSAPDAAGSPLTVELNYPVVDNVADD